nr:hypothetical protein [Tanacetum cinerariifolium]
MILRDGDERLTLNMRHDTSSYSNQPQKESINLINVFNDSSKDFLKNLFSTNHQSGNPTFSSHPELTSPEVKDDIFDPEGGNVLIKKLLDLDSTKDLHPPHHVSTTSSSSLNQLLKEFDIDSILNDSVDQNNLANFNDNLANAMPEMFTDEHALDYSSPPLYDEYDDDLFKIEPDQGKLTSIVMKDNLAEPRVHVPNVLTTHPTLMMDSDFIPSDNSLPEYEIFYFDIEEKNSGSTTIHAVISLSDLESFNFDFKPIQVS